MSRQAKPVLPESLLPIEHGLEWLHNCKEKEEEINGVCLKEINAEEEDFSQLIVSGVKFMNCRFWNCHMEWSEFTDVVFQSCDFSGSKLDDCHFNRAEFLFCKSIGTSFTGNRMHHIIIQDCNMDYANLDNSVLNQFVFENVELNSGNFSQCRCKDILWKQVQLKNTSFFKTPLWGMDFRECSIDGLLLSEHSEELQGAIVDIYQAAELAKRLGILIK